MQTETVFACFVEEGDFILINGYVLEVVQIKDSVDLLRFDLKDTEDGITRPGHYPPFDHVTVITSFEETFEWEDVDIDA